MKEQQDTTVSLLRQIAQQRGLEYLREGNGKFFINAFAEMGGDEQDVTLLQYLTQCGGHEDLLDAGKLTPAMQRACYSQTVRKLCDKTLIPEHLAHQVCSAFWQGIYGTKPPVEMKKAREEKPVPPPPVPTPKPIDKEDKPDPIPPVPNPKPRKFKLKYIAIPMLLLALVLVAVSILNDSTGKRTRSDLTPYGLEKSIEDMLLAGTEQIYTYPDGTRMEFYYDDAGKEIYRVYVNSENEIENLFEARYDSAGRLVYHQIFDGQGNLLRADSYDFHSSEDTAQRRVTLGDGRYFQGTSTFDENGYETFTLNHQDGTKAVYVYKDGGVLTNLTEYDAAGEIIAEPIAFEWWENQPKVYGPRQTVIGWAGSNGYVRPYVQGICGGKLREYSVEDDYAYIETYDPMGNLLEQLYYRDGQLNALRSREVYSYDAQGNYTGYTETYYSSYYDGDYDITSYDEKGIKLSRESHYFRDEKENIYSCRYETELDDQGRVICVRTINEETNLVDSVEEFEYDSQGNKQKHTSITYSVNRSYRIYVMDGEGKALSNVHYYPNGNIYSQTEYTEDGIQRRWTVYYENGQLERVAEYNDKGEEIKSVYYNEDGTIVE